MILFIFEGKKQEPRIFQTMQYLFFSSLPEKQIHVAYCSHIVSLFNKMQKLDVFDHSSDVVQVLKSEIRARDKKTEDDMQFLQSSADAYSQIFLFFDYDPQKKNVEEQSVTVKAMLDYFCDETDKGKLYLNYPMIESIRYFKSKLPDYDFYQYTSAIALQGKFKEEVAKISFYKDLRFIAFDFNPKKNQIKIPDNKSRIEQVRDNWEDVNELTIKKANYICSENNEYPEEKSLINQQKIFENQLEKYIKKQKVAILNAFPLFLYEFFRISKEANP